MESTETNPAQAEPSQTQALPNPVKKPRRPRVNMALAGLLLAQGMDYDTIAKKVGSKNGHSIRINLCRKGVTKSATKTMHDGDPRLKNDTIRLVAQADKALKESLNARLLQAVDRLGDKEITYDDLANNGQGHASVLKTLAETHRAINGSSDQVQVTFGVSLVEDRELHAPVIDIN